MHRLEPILQAPRLSRFSDRLQVAAPLWCSSAAGREMLPRKARPWHGGRVPQQSGRPRNASAPRSRTWRGARGGRSPGPGAPSPGPRRRSGTSPPCRGRRCEGTGPTTSGGRSTRGTGRVARPGRSNPRGCGARLEGRREGRRLFTATLLGPCQATAAADELAIPLPDASIRALLTVVRHLRVDSAPPETAPELVGLSTEPVSEDLLRHWAPFKPLGDPGPAARAQVELQSGLRRPW